MISFFLEILYIFIIWLEVFIVFDFVFSCDIEVFVGVVEMIYFFGVVFEVNVGIKCGDRLV